METKMEEVTTNLILESKRMKVVTMISLMAVERKVVEEVSI